MKQLYMKPDAFLFPSFSTLQSDTIYNLFLVANVEKEINIPKNADYAIFSFTDDIWVKFNGTAEVPAADNLDGSGSELNPSSRYLFGASTIHIISGVNCAGSISFYKE
ncbi:MAG: hypothetical protein ACOCUI_03550 [bacterium]